MDGVQGFEPLTATRQQRSAVCLTLSQLHIPRKQVSSLGRLITHTEPRTWTELSSRRWKDTWVSGNAHQPA